MSRGTWMLVSVIFIFQIIILRSRFKECINYTETEFFFCFNFFCILILYDNLRNKFKATWNWLISGEQGTNEISGSNDFDLNFSEFSGSSEKFHGKFKIETTKCFAHCTYWKPDDYVDDLCFIIGPINRKLM